MKNKIKLEGSWRESLLLIYDFFKSDSITVRTVYTNRHYVYASDQCSVALRISFSCDKFVI